MKFDLHTNGKKRRHRDQMRMSLRLMEFWVSNGLIFPFGFREREIREKGEYLRFVFASN